MKNVSQTYKDIRASGLFHYDIQIIVGDEIYDQHTLKSLKIRYSLLKDSQPSIGGTNAASVELELFETMENWPRGSSFRIFFRIVSDEPTEVGEETPMSEWVPCGQFFTDTRKYSNGVLSIVAYDAMLMTETTWYDKIANNDMPAEFPITAYEAARLALGAIGLELEGTTFLDNTVRFIGLDTKATVRDTLRDIASGMGGNWGVTTEGKMRLFPFKRFSDRSGTSAIAGIAIVGRAIVGAEEPEEDIPVIHLGKATKQFTIGSVLDAIVGVELTADDGTTARTPEKDGYWMSANCNFSNSRAANLCLNQLYNYRYKSFSADGAFLDPAADVGDFVEIDDNEFIIHEMTVNFGLHFSMEISAPYEEEIDHEYKIISESTKNLRKSLQAIKAQTTDLRQELSSSIQQTATAIRTEVSENYYKSDSVDELVEGVRSEVVQTADGLIVSITNVQAEASGAINELQKYISYVNGVVTIGETENPSTLRVSANEVGLYYNGARTTYWNQNEQVTPNKVRIPEGGTLQEGNFIWQPRTSGNLSLMWVGGS